jgi:hypothetical protein
MATLTKPKLGTVKSAKPVLGAGKTTKPVLGTSKTSKPALGGSAINADLSTSQGLMQVASQAGLEKRAKEIISSKGESPKKIFSGGFISDIMDGLNALQYGVTGLLKGKGFVEGVKTRQSFTDKDALGDKGIPGMIGGIALDIAVDPLTYIAPWTVLKKLGAAEKLAGATKIAEKTKVGQWFGQKFIYMFGKDPIYKEAWERSVRNIAVGSQNLGDLAKGVVDMAPEKVALLLSKDEVGRFVRTPLAKLKNSLTPEEFSKVSTAYKNLDDLGKQAVDLGLLSKEKYEDNLGEYIKNAYSEYERGKNKGIFKFLQKKVTGIKGRLSDEELASTYLRSVGTTKETPHLFSKSGAVLIKHANPSELKDLAAKGLKQMSEKLGGQIDNPGYLLFKSSFDLLKDVENAKFFDKVATQFGTDTAREGFKQITGVATRFGKLAGKWVPEGIYDDITELTKPREIGVGNKIVGAFKYAKVILNPATHARNVMSNQLLNWWKLGLGPWRQDLYLEALGQIKNGGKWVDEAKTVGYGLNTFASNELRDFFLGPEGRKAFGKKIEKLSGKLTGLYQGEENFAKLSAFIYKRKQGMGIEEAWKAAESATFNYSQVTPFVRQLRTSIWGYPFITFAIKSAPIAVETAFKHPGRISALGKIKTAIENQSDIQETTRERASEPQWIKDGFYIKLPIKDKYGRSAYFDLTYIVPFGDLASGQFLERQVSRETGLPESIPSATMSKSPLFGLVKELSRNQDFYGDKIWRESDTTEQQLGDIFRHLTKTMAPPLVADQIPGGYMSSTGERRLKGVAGALTAEQNIKQQRTLMQELLRNLGMKIQPIDTDIQETYMEWEKQKALQNLAVEQGAIKEFTRPFIPKE